MRVAVACRRADWLRRAIVRRLDAPHRRSAEDPCCASWHQLLPEAVAGPAAPADPHDPEIADPMAADRLDLENLPELPNCFGQMTSAEKWPATTRSQTPDGLGVRSSPSPPSGAAVARLRDAAFPAASAAQSFVADCAADLLALPGVLRARRASRARPQLLSRAAPGEKRSARFHTGSFPCPIRDRRDWRDRARRCRCPRLRRSGQRQPRSCGRWPPRAAGLAGPSVRVEEHACIAWLSICPRKAPSRQPRPACLC